MSKIEITNRFNQFVRVLQVALLTTTMVTVSAQTPILSPLTYESLLPAFNRLTSDSNRCIALIEYDGYDNLSIGKPDRLLFNGGYCSFTNNNLSSAVFHYYDCDHQGNIRAVVNENGTKEQITHYYPFGGIIADISTNQTLQPYKYNGKELDRMHGLDTYDYGARQYNHAYELFNKGEKRNNKKLI